MEDNQEVQNQSLELPQVYKDSTFLDIFRDSHREWSSKRVAAFISLGCIIISWISNTYFKVEVNLEILRIFEVIVVGGLALSVSEWFRPKD